MSRGRLLQRVARNASALYVVQFASYLVPLLEIPILARALGPLLYGQILFCQALALSASVVTEYGFNLNAAQQVARDRTPSALARLLTDVTGARVLLATPMIGLWLWLGWSLTLDGQALQPTLVPFVVAYFIAYGFSPMWYFQGLERMVFPAAVDVALRLGGVIVLAVLVRAPADFQLALILLAAPPLLNTLVTSLWAGLEAGMAGWHWRGSCHQLRTGFHFFAFRGATQLSLSAVPVGLGAAAGQRAVGEFGPAEKLVKGMVSLAQPLLMALYPLCARGIAAGDRRALGGALRLLVLMGLCSVAGTGLAAWCGPWILDGMLGDGFPGAHAVFFWLIALVPLRILSQGMIVTLLLPAGRARAVSRATLAFSAVAVICGTALSVRWGGRGMAWGLLFGEGLLLLVLALQVRDLWRAWHQAERTRSAATDKPLRILLVSTGLKMGGAERQVVDLADSLAARGARVGIAYLTDGVSLRPRHRRVHLYPLHCTRSIPGLLRGVAALVGLVYRWRPDVVHSHMVHANLLARAARLLAPMPCLICTAHSNQEGGRGLMLAYRLSNGMADLTTHVSRAAAREYERAGAVPAGTMRTVYNGIDLSRYAAVGRAAASGLSGAGRRQILAVGRLVPEKNHAGLLRAFALLVADHPDVSLQIVGDGPLREPLVRLRAELGLEERVRFLGERDDVPDRMRRADLVVLSSRIEGFGLVVAEAMAAGSLVVATDVGGVAEVLGDHGILIPPGDVAALARGMSRALALDPLQVRFRVARNRAYVAGHFDMRVLAGQWLRVYREMRRC